MKHPLYAACAALLASASAPAGAQAKQDADAAFARPAVVESVFTSDLDRDPAFGTGGSAIYDFNVLPSHNQDIGMRTFYRCEFPSGSCPVEYTVGYHYNGTTFDVLVEKTFAGAPMNDWGVAGQMRQDTGMHILYDAAFDPVSGRLYLVGGEKLFVAPTDFQFSVYCVDLDVGTACPDFGSQGHQYVVFNLGGGNADIATRVVLDPDGYLYVAGYADATNGYEVAVAKLTADTGAFVPQFGGTGQAHYPVSSRPSGRDVDVFDMVLVAPAAGAKQLYLVGDYKNDAGDYDGFLLWLSPATGVGQNMRTFSHESDNTQPAADAMTAITLLANGELALAGYSATNVATEPTLLLAKVHTDAVLGLDTAFCGGGICSKTLFGAGLNKWQNTLPTAIGERPSSRDLVVAMQAGTWTQDFVTGLFHVSQRQVVQQYSASGLTLHAEAQMDFASDSSDTPNAFSAGMLMDDYSVLLTGSRRWQTSSGDYDITLTRLLANDTIFTSRFGTPSSD